ncbi:MAG TPA: hypothetical protein VGN33_08980 [Leifsonia sp.]|nr:hypothetical protein [Leifsonia sp.]
MGKRARTKNRHRGKKNAPERWWLTVLLTNGVLSLLFAAPLLWYVWAVATGRGLFDGQLLLGLSLLGAAAVALVSWIPHLILIDDDGLPKFAHEKNTPFTFWWLVITLGLCTTLLALAPIFPLADGYHFSDTGITFTRASRSTPVALWIAAPPIWAVSALLFYFIGRGLWQHYRPAGRESGDPAFQAIESLVPLLRGKLNLTEEQRQERAKQVRKRRAEREKRPEGRLNLPGFVTMFLWVSTILMGLPLPSLLMWAWPVNVRFPLGGLVFLMVGTGWLVLTTRLKEPKSWLVLAGLGGLFLVAALLLLSQGVAPPLIAAVAALYGAGHLSVGLFKWFRTEKPTG